MSFINPNNRLREYILQETEDVDSLDNYGVFIYLEEDEFAKYDVRQRITQKPVVKMTNDLYKLPPLGLFRTSETIKVKIFGYFNKNLLDKILDYNRRGRDFIFEVKKEEDLKLISKLVGNNDEDNQVKVFDKKDFKEELDWCTDKIEEWAGQVSNQLSVNLKYTLSYYMLRNMDKWNDIKLMFDIEDTVDEEKVAEYFEGMESYNTDEWIDSVLLGNRKGKNIVILDYLLNIKDMQPYFIIDLIKRRIESYLEVISLMDKGVIGGTETSESEITKRCDYLGITASEVVLSDKREKLVENLTIFKRTEVDYCYDHILNLITTKNKYTIKIQDIVYLIDKFRLSKTKDRKDEINKGMFKLSQKRQKKRKNK